MSTVVSNSSIVNTLSENLVSTNSHINIKKVEFIDGIKLEALKKDAYQNLAKDPLVGYGTILNGIESRLYSSQPENLLRTNVQKYMKESNLYLVELNNSYKFRPDIVSHIFYGTNEYFHLVLMANSMKTFLEFIPENFNNLIFVLKPNIITSI